MADSKISALPAATVALAGTEVLPIVQSSTTKQVSVANLTAGRAISASTVTATTTMGVGAATPSTSGAGITFPATQSASSNANTLDDYEEGTFTPVATYSGTNTPTYSGQLGRYTKIGRIVQIQILLSWNENGSTGNLLITGLPFTSVLSNTRAVPSFLSYGLLLVTSSITGYVENNFAYIVPMVNDNTGTQISATNTDNDQDLYITVTYETA